MKSGNAAPGDSDSELKDIVARLGEPFAKALATFARETQVAAKEEARQKVVKQLESSTEFNTAIQKIQRRSLAEYREAQRKGKVEEIDFDDIPVPKKNLRTIALNRGLTQKQVAKRAGMDPAAVSRVFRNPERSRVSTLKRITEILEVNIGEVV